MAEPAPGKPSVPDHGREPLGPLPPDEVRALVAQGSLGEVGGRPPLRAYLRDLVRRRAFVWEYAKGRAYRRNTDNVLGQAWTVLNPLLSVGAYFVVFGLLLDTRRGVENYIGFLTVGIFIFSFLSATLTVGSRSILRNQAFMRSLRFPRAVLPVASVLTEMLLLLPAVAVLVVVLLISGEPLRWTFLLLPVALLLLFAFATGAALFTSRIVAQNRDLDNLIPVIMRIARYVSGVFFSVSAYAGTGALGVVMQYQPLALFLDLVRSCVMVEVPMNPMLWVAATAWAAVALVGGIVYFWRAEASYGRG